MWDPLDQDDVTFYPPLPGPTSVEEYSLGCFRFGYRGRSACPFVQDSNLLDSGWVPLSHPDRSLSRARVRRVTEEASGESFVGGVPGEGRRDSRYMSPVSRSYEF